MINISFQFWNSAWMDYSVLLNYPSTGLIFIDHQHHEHYRLHHHHSFSQCWICVWMGLHFTVGALCAKFENSVQSLSLQMYKGEDRNAHTLDYISHIFCWYFFSFCGLLIIIYLEFCSLSCFLFSSLKKEKRGLLVCVRVCVGGCL